MIPCARTRIFQLFSRAEILSKKPSITRPARGDPTRPVKLESLIARPDPTRQISSTPTSTVDETGLKRRDFRNLRTGPAGTSTIHGQPCFFGSPIWVPKADPLVHPRSMYSPVFLDLLSGSQRCSCRTRATIRQRHRTLIGRVLF